MDRVKLGRALGYGTRHAAKTLAAVVEAAAAPPPEGTSQRAGGVATPVAEPARSVPRPQDAREQPRSTVRPVAGSVRQGARQGARSLWGPLAVYSGALWLRVTGVFFAVIALSLGMGAWRLRAAYRPGSPGVHHFWIFVGFATAFAYFAVSGFVRADLKERRAAGRGAR